ncbi:MAG: hypothetical protein R3C25_03460 [Hyphomonadaceae bacterium]
MPAMLQQRVMAASRRYLGRAQRRIAGIPRALGGGALAVGRGLLRFGGELRSNPQARDRAMAFGAFAAIFAIGITSVDLLITGSADIEPAQAYAMEVAQPRTIAPPTILAAAPAPVTQPVAQLVALPLEEVDYSVAAEELLGGPDTMLAAQGAGMPEWFGDDPAPLLIEASAKPSDVVFAPAAGAAKPKP